MRPNRFCICLVILALFAGCQKQDTATSRSPSATSSSPPAADNGLETQLAVARPQPQDVPNLWTRTKGEDWAKFLGPTADGKSAEKGLFTEWPPEGPRLVWQMRLGTSYGPPAVSRGRLFTFDRHDVRRGAPGQARLTCFNAETAEELWRFEYPTDYVDMYGYNNGPRCPPVVENDRVYIRGAEGMLHCVSVLDGEMLWRVNLAERFNVVQNFFGEGSTPVVEGDLLIAQVGGSPKGSNPQINLGTEGDGSGVVAFDKYTGEIRYAITDELCSYSSPELATIDNRRWCFVFSRGGLIGFNPEDGKVDWFFPWRANILESVNASNPVVVANRVLISETYGPGSALLEVQPTRFELVWSDEDRGRDKSLQTHWNTPIYHEGYLYGSSGRHTNNAELRCVDFETGEVQWSERGLGRSSLTYADGHLICQCEYGELILLEANPEKFDLVAKVELVGEEDERDIPGLTAPRLLDYPAWAAPVLSHGLLFVRGNSRLACLEVVPE